MFVKGDARLESARRVLAYSGFYGRILRLDLRHRPVRPTRYLSPVGAGTPPAGSRMTASATGVGMSCGVAMCVVMLPCASGVSRPALMGAFCAATTQSWYVLFGGSAGRWFAANTSPCVRLQNARAAALGATGWPARSTFVMSG